MEKENIKILKIRNFLLQKRINKINNYKFHNIKHRKRNKLSCLPKTVPKTLQKENSDINFLSVEKVIFEKIEEF